MIIKTSIIRNPCTLDKCT